MRKLKGFILTLLFVFLSISGASAVTTIDLYEWALNTDGTLNNTTLPAGISSTSGLGTGSVTITGAGSHNFIAYFDHEIDQTLNTYFNEFGSTSGLPGSGQSWEIDEPGFVSGDIYNNVVAGALDNSNGVPSSTPDDVSMALGWNFILNVGETATIRLVLSETSPTGGFYLTQTDPGSQASLYFYSTLEIKGGGTQVPEPATLLLLGTGMVGLIGLGRRKFRK